jgi:hypothetical protein
MFHLRTLLSGLLLTGATGICIAACGDDSAQPDGSGGDGTGGGANSGVCILHNCAEDAHCDGCAEGRNTCRIEEGGVGRCVACDAETGTGCPAGQQCSSFGQCVPEGLECPTNPEGVPQISCTTSADCAACSPAHQVCDTSTNTCVACTENDTAECQSTDICLDGQCAQACSAMCTVDNDCGMCPAKACNKHKCSECSATYACPSGEYCNLDNGTCQKVCGKVGAPGVCENDAECAGCGASLTNCDVPINGGLGTCGPNATGCSDLGNGALVLPDPWGQVTQTCSNDNDCDGEGITYNVGEALRDLTGLGDDIIADANLEYPMAACASITIAGNSCGVCVPCRQDVDCMDIDIDQFTSDLFPGLGGIAVAVLLDQLFGPNDHKIYMYCEQIAGGFGICAPCPGLLNDCGVIGGGGGGGGSGNCDHSPDTEGGPLDPSCGECEETVCALDSYCCDTAWDDVCVDEAATECGNACHDPCVTGGPMGASCGTCEGDVCAADPFCCDNSWDSACIIGAQDVCGITCN